jgi:hypothetical protein
MTFNHQNVGSIPTNPIDINMPELVDGVALGAIEFIFV